MSSDNTYQAGNEQMKLTIFGATGATGKQLIEQALAAGNSVVAFVRNPSKIGASSEQLTVLQGELADSAAIERAVRGADAVLSVLGPRPQEDLRGRPLSRGMENILAAMRKTGVRRLIITSTPSAADPKDLPDAKIKLLVAMIKTAMRPRTMKSLPPRGSCASPTPIGPSCACRCSTTTPGRGRSGPGIWEPIRLD